MSAQEIGDFCKEHGLLFILDTAQTAGIIDIDMEKYHIDALAFTGHKLSLIHIYPLQVFH